MLMVPASQRLCYGLLSANDAELLFDVDQDEEVMRFINGGKRIRMHWVMLMQCCIRNLLR